MTYIDTPEPAEAVDRTREMYERAAASYGYLPNMVRAFGHAPEVMDGWNNLISAIRARMDPRRYELVTLAAAHALGSSYCMLAHGKVLLDQGMTAADLARIAQGAPGAPLTAQEQAVMDYAVRVVRSAGSVGPDDIDQLRAHGLSEADIFDVAAAAAVRSFFSKLLDALGALPDRAYLSLDPGLRGALTVGRPIER